MERTTIILIITITLLVGAGLYIVIDKIDILGIEKIRNESYALGFNQGVEQWNSAVIYQVNTEGKIPYWFNGSYFQLNIAQLCEQ